MNYGPLIIGRIILWLPITLLLVPITELKLPLTELSWALLGFDVESALAFAWELAEALLDDSEEDTDEAYTDVVDCNVVVVDEVEHEELDELKLDGPEEQDDDLDEVENPPEDYELLLYPEYESEFDCDNLDPELLEVWLLLEEPEFYSAQPIYLDYFLISIDSPDLD